MEGLLSPLSRLCVVCLPLSKAGQYRVNCYIQFIFVSVVDLVLLRWTLWRNFQKIDMYDIVMKGNGKRTLTICRTRHARPMFNVFYYCVFYYYIWLSGSYLLLQVLYVMTMWHATLHSLGYVKHMPRLWQSYLKIT